MTDLLKINRQNLENNYYLCEQNQYKINNLLHNMKYSIHIFTLCYILIFISSCGSGGSKKDYLSDDTLSINIDTYKVFYESLPEYIDSIDKTGWLDIVNYMNQAINYLNTSYQKDLNIESDKDFKYVIDSLSRPNRDICQEIFRQLNSYYELARQYKFDKEFNLSNEFDNLHNNITDERNTYKKYEQRIQSLKDEEILNQLKFSSWKGELEGENNITATTEYSFSSNGDGYFDLERNGVSIFQKFKYTVEDNYLILTNESGDNTYYYIYEFNEHKFVFGSSGAKKIVLFNKHH